MKNLLSYTLLVLFLFVANAIYAQNGSESLASKTLPTLTSKSPKSTDDIEEARRRFKTLFNLYRDFSITIDTISLNNTELSSKNVQDNETPLFGAYLGKMTGILSKKVDKVTSNSAESRAERSHYLAGLNTLKSAKCLQTDNQSNTFARTRDMNNNAIMAFDLDGLRSSSRYGLVENYKEGFSRIRKDQVFGFLNLCGNEVITCQYEQAEPFNAGQALVKRVDWFFVDSEGNETEPLENVADAKSLKHGISWVRMNNNKQALIDNNYATSKVSISQFYDAIDSFYRKDVFRVRNGKKMGLIGLDGKTIFDAIYDNIEPTNRMGVYRIYQNKGVGLLDTTWVIRTSPTYESISDFDQYGLATATNKKGTAFIHSKTYKMSKFYETVTEFNQFGVSTISNEGNLFGLLDTNLAVVVMPKYGAIGSFNELGLASACYPAGKCGFIKYDGTEQIKANYEAVGNFNNYGLAVVRTILENCNGNNSCKTEVIIDQNGNTIVPITDESIKRKLHYQMTDSLHDDRYIIVNVMEENIPVVTSYMLINKNNLQLITNTPYRSIAPMDIFGNIRVEKKGKWGMIDSLGKLITKPTYLEIKRVNDAYYATQNEKGKWGFLNKKGKPQVPFEYQEVRSYRFGFAPVSKGRGKWGLINRFNAKIVPCAFRTVMLNEAETKFQIIDDDNVTFIISDKGECESNCPKFEDLRAKANKASDLEAEKNKGDKAKPEKTKSEKNKN
jgi:WG containing repeat